jgi:hypothetical protein
MTDQVSNGFILNDAAMYSYECQDVYKDLISFAAAIPEHLRSVFLVPVSAQIVTASQEITKRVASEYSPSGSTPDGDLFSYQTFVNYDNEPTNPEPSYDSMFDVDYPSDRPKHQEFNPDDNITPPSDTSYMSDIDITQYIKYPYRTDEKPVRKSSKNQQVMIVKLAYEKDYLMLRTDDKILNNSKKCTINLLSYDKNTQIYTFNVKCGGPTHRVKSIIRTPDEVALTCDCDFWRWNGPEFHAKYNGYLLGQPSGTAKRPEKRDPNDVYWLCKHAYAVLDTMDKFIESVKEEADVEKEDEVALMGTLDEKWDKLPEVIEEPVEEPVEETVEEETEETVEEEIDYGSVDDDDYSYESSEDDDVVDGFSEDDSDLF